MKSTRSSKPLDLSRDLPTRAADIVALRQARKSDRMSFEAYLKFLASLPAPSLAELRARKGPAGNKPFGL